MLKKIRGKPRADGCFGAQACAGRRMMMQKDNNEKESGDMERPNAWKSYDEKQLKQLEELCSDYRRFLDDGKTERECVKLTVSMAEAAGYKTQPT